MGSNPQYIKKQVTHGEKLQAVCKAIEILRSLGTATPTREIIARRAARIVGLSVGTMLGFMADKLTAEKKRAIGLPDTRVDSDVTTTP